MTLAALAELAGLAATYHDVWGQTHRVSDDTLARLLASLGLASATAEEQEASEAYLRAAGARPLPHVTVLDAQLPSTLSVTGALAWEVHKDQEHEHEHEHEPLHMGEASRNQVLLPPLPMGYYLLRVACADASVWSGTLLVAPPRCWAPAGEMRFWGVAAQLYALRSQKNMGVGDFGDLTALLQGVAAQGGHLVGVNPMHAMFTAQPEAFSPYSPSHRMFLNTLYLAVEQIAEFETCEAAQAIWRSETFQRTLAALRAVPLVDYVAISALKQTLLRPLFAAFQAAPEPQPYRDFCAEHGEALQVFALFEALSEHFAAPMREWPEMYQQRDSDETQAFAREHAEAIRYHCWLQWLADTQLARCQAAALGAGMQVGLYRDLAVGPDAQGAELWSAPAHFLADASVGAPPDLYNPKGQCWGLPALHPHVLEAQGMRPFRELLRANMRHARALRIDHAFGLARLFLIPAGGNEEGAYLAYPFDAMLAVLRIESHLQQCLVIGEDLGTFPPGYPEKAALSGVFSYKLLYFEQQSGAFLPPRRYPAQALAAISTHDLPTFASWCAGTDIDERAALQLYPAPGMAENDRAQRARDAQLLTDALTAEGLSPLSAEAIERYLARSPARLMMLQLEDVLGLTVQANLPTTTSERPNWRIKLPVTTQEALQALARFASLMNEERARPALLVPRALYRLQFHKGFTFDDAVRIMPYLQALGISHVYASPYLQARPGSTHGYDITDPHRVNEELGGAAGYARFVEALRMHGLGQILDTVPNHMGIGSDNAWWMHVLAEGRESPYARYFDVDWQPRAGETRHRIVLPVLGSHYGDALVSGEIQLARMPEQDAYGIRACEQIFPLRADDQAEIAALGLDHFNRDNDALHALLERQHYRLSYWRVAASDINYRRFFDINTLAGMRPEDPIVFADMHAWVLPQIHAGNIDGLRLDHVDGLADPAGYCRALKAAAGEGLYLTVEKILASHEMLRTDWGIQGTSGYDALIDIGALFVAYEHEAAVTELYQSIKGEGAGFAELVFAAKIEVLQQALSSELQRLTLRVARTARDRYHRDYTFETLRTALCDLIGWFPVYRTYVTIDARHEDDVRAIDWACGLAKKHTRLPEDGVYDFIAGLLRPGLRDATPEKQDVVRSFQQLSGPVMAKGMEDTTFYRYVRLLSLNEVGGDPARFGITVKQFHHATKQRFTHFPHAMIATATHDTKRGEDGRLRISLLSHIPQQFEEMVRKCMTCARSYRSKNDRVIVPSPTEEYALYQTLLGSWPVELLRESWPENAADAYRARIRAYLVKALREAKVHSSWTHPDENYEQAFHRFTDALLDASKPNKFLEEFVPFVRKLAEAGARLSLVQAALKLTMPGVPDIYQGDEYWDTSLVDPDNRRPVDYAAREASLAESAPLAELARDWQDGRIKQQIIRRLLAARRDMPDLFACGDYVPLPVHDHVLAFTRHHQSDTLVFIARTRDAALTPEAFAEEISVPLPLGRYRNVLTEEIMDIEESASPLPALLGPLPVAVLIAQ